MPTIALTGNFTISLSQSKSGTLVQTFYTNHPLQLLADLSPSNPTLRIQTKEQSPKTLASFIIQGFSFSGNKMIVSSTTGYLHITIHSPLQNEGFSHPQLFIDLFFQLIPLFLHFNPLLTPILVLLSTNHPLRCFPHNHLQTNNYTHHLAN